MISKHDVHCTKLHEDGIESHTPSHATWSFELHRSVDTHENVHILHAVMLYILRSSVYKKCNWKIQQVPLCDSQTDHLFVQMSRMCYTNNL